MRVKVTPRDGAGNPIPGAGSFEVEADRCQGRFYLPETDTLLPASWCEPIPEITPEPGDICQTVEDDQLFILNRYEHGKWYLNKTAHFVGPVRVLARKPKRFEDVRGAIKAFGSEWCDSDTEAGERDAYEDFLSAILGVPYGRVGE